MCTGINRNVLLPPMLISNNSIGREDGNIYIILLMCGLKAHNNILIKKIIKN